MHGRKIQGHARHAREYYSPGRLLVSVDFNLGTTNLGASHTGSALSHEIGHMIDHAFSGKKHFNTFLWERSNFTSFAEGSRLRALFRKQHSGKIGTYSNGDGQYYKNN